MNRKQVAKELKEVEKQAGSLDSGDFRYTYKCYLCPEEIKTLKEIPKDMYPLCLKCGLKSESYLYQIRGYVSMGKVYEYD